MTFLVERTADAPPGSLLDAILLCCLDIHMFEVLPDVFVYLGSFPSSLVGTVSARWCRGLMMNNSSASGVVSVKQQVLICGVFW